MLAKSGGDGLAAQAEDEAPSDEETPAEDAAPVDEGSLTEGEISEPTANDAISDDDDPADGENPVGEDDGSIDTEDPTSSEGGATDTDADGAAVEEPATEESAEDSNIVEESIADALESEIALTADESDFTWAGTTITGYSGTAKDVVIPSNATAIGKSAFANKDYIESVTFTGPTTEIGASAFNHCDKLKQVVLPLELETIGDNAFYYCASLTDISLPNGVKTIGSYAFGRCSALTEIDLPDSIETIDYCAFELCTALTEINIPSSIKRIENSTFRFCDSLAKVTLPDSLEQVGEEAFRDTGLSYICIPASVTSIGRNAFSTVERLEYAEGTTTALRTYATKVTEVVFPDTITTIGATAFTDCTQLVHIDLPENLQTIGNSAFSGCTALKEIGWNRSLNKIGAWAFRDCTALTELNLKLIAVNTIGGSSFRGCTSLATLILPETLQTLENNAFEGCTALTQVTIPASVTSAATDYRYGPFVDCTNLTRICYAEGTTTVLPVGATYASEVEIPSTATEIAYYAFANYSVLESIEIPDTVEVIQNFAFYNCTNLTRIHLPGGLDSSKTGALRAYYMNCTPLEYVEFGEGMTTVPNSFLEGQTQLTTVVLASTVQSIGNRAFMDCSGLTTINLPEGLESIGYKAFANCSSLTTISLPEGLERIEYQAFENCTSLTEIKLPGGIQYIGQHAFYDCISLTILRFEGNDDLYIDNEAFGSSGESTRDVLVYCASGSKVYDYFVNREGYRIVATNSIKYVLNGGTNASGNPGSYMTGDDLTFQEPTRPGYAFGGWYTDSRFTKPFVYDKDSTTGNLTLYAKWTEITYKVTYDLNGGAFPQGKTNPAAYTASKDVMLVAPTRAGAAFTGWLVNGTDTVITNGKIAANTYAQDLTLIAQWREYSYQLIWNKNAKDATGSMDSVTLAVSQAYTIPEESYTRAGYDFLGWNTAANGKGKSYVEGDVVQGLATKEGAKVTLYAQWQTSIYEIVYVLNDSDASPAVNHKSNPDSYNVSQKVSLKTPTRNGYLFDGWYTDAALTTKVTTITSTLGDVTVYAKWTPITYTITFNKNKGTLPVGAAMNNITATYDKAETLPANVFTRTGYTFLGWDLTASSKAEEPAYKDGAEVSNLSSKNKGKVTLYAKWQVNQIPIKYVLNDSEEDPATNPAKNPAYVTIEKNVVLAAPTRAGYKFGGWYTDKALTQALAKNTIAKTTTDPITVYASWIENSYTLKLDKNGGTYDIPQDVVGKHEYEEEFLLPDGTGASRENYTFTGWNTRKDRSGEHYGLDPETGENKPVSGLATKGTVTLYAEWTPVEGRTYTITYYNVDGGDNSKNPDTYSFEKDVKLVNPTRTGYTFKGWYAEDPAENPKAKKVTTISKKTTGNVEVYGVWTENTYTIAYNGNKGTLPKGVKMPAQTVLYSEAVTLTTNAFTRKGYTFTGWNTKANGSGDAYDDGKEVSQLIAKAKGKITLYAQWQADGYTITYVGAEDGVDGVVNTNPTTYTIEKDVKLVNPTAYGYTFKGWYNDDPEENAKAKKVAKIAKTTAADVTVYALWSENRYSLRFSTNALLGSSVKSITNRLYTDTLTIPSTIPAKDGYTFQGWALTRDGAVVCKPGDQITFAELHEAGGVARGLVGTKYMTLYAIFE